LIGKSKNRKLSMISRSEQKKIKTQKANVKESTGCGWIGKEVLKLPERSSGMPGGRLRVVLGVVGPPGNIF
jgi:hypothetical protein